MEEISTTEYVYISTLGEGKFGKVFKVSSKKDDKQYALKVIDMETQNVTFAEVVKEIDFLQDIDHPNVVKIFDALEIQTSETSVLRIGILMQLCELGDLETFIHNRNGRRFRSQTMHKWMLELSSAVGFIHSQGILHRDLNLRNVFIDENTSLKIGDFGIAKNVLNSLAGTKVGSTLFMAPETLTGSYYLEADVYSLGCIFLCMAVLELKPKSANGVFHSLPDKVAYGENKRCIIEKCLKSRKSERPSAMDIYNKLITDTYETLCFSYVRSPNVNLAVNPYVAFRDRTSNESGVLFSSRPLKPGERFCLQFNQIFLSKDSTTLTFGFMTAEPEGLKLEKIRTTKDVEKQTSPRECWIVTHRCKLNEKSKLSFWFEKNGSFAYTLDGVTSKNKETLPSWRLLWALFEIHTDITEVKLIDFE